MNRFLAFVKKEFRHIFRDYRTMLMLFVMPIAQILIFGYVISNDIKNAKIGFDGILKEFIQVDEKGIVNLISIVLLSLYI